MGLCWSRLWPCIIGVCRCSGDALVGVVVGEGVGSGAGSHHALVVEIVAGEGVGTSSHHSSDVDVCCCIHICVCGVCGGSFGSCGRRSTGFAAVAVVACSALREELKVRLVDLVVGLGNL